VNAFSVFDKFGVVNENLSRIGARPTRPSPKRFIIKTKKTSLLVKMNGLTEYAHFMLAEFAKPG
jgi:hypothetical protein